jgi:glycosyltransferase involved in cell wall biosynthesis
MMLGMPVVALATTEYPSVLKDDQTGFISNDVDYLVSQMKRLLAKRELASLLGAEARRVAQKRFDLNRFTRDWEYTFRLAIESNTVHYETNSIYQ